MDWLVDRIFPFRRLTVWLGVLVFGVSLITLLLTALLVLPSLDQSLVDDRVDTVAASAESSAPAFASNFADALSGDASTGDTNSLTAAYGAITNTQATVYQVVAGDQLAAVTEPAPPTPGGVARRAAASSDVEQGVGQRGNVRVAEAAYTMQVGGTRYVVLLQSNLGNVDAAVALTRRRSLLGALLALPLTVAAGVLGAALLTRRIRRLEQASTRIANGNLSTPIEDRGRDEIGDLAVSLDRMRNELAATDAARRAFVANASHELRTPVFAISGFLELLLDEDDEEHRRSFLATMKDQVDRLTRLATDLLDLSRLDAGKVAIEREPVELSAVADAVARDLAPIAARRSATLVVDPGAAMALGDETRIGQIARVLVDNAMRHNPEGVEIRIISERNGAIARLRVEDTGPPIPDADVVSIFTRFSRGTGAGEGSGLGLAIASELAERMGGRLFLDQTGPHKAFCLDLDADPTVGG